MADGAVTELTAATFDAVAADPAGRPVLVKFFTPWCPPCRALGPAYAHLAGRYTGRVVFAEVNADEETALAERFGVRGVPTVLVFRGDAGDPERGIESATPDDVEDLLGLIAPG